MVTPPARKRKNKIVLIKPNNRYVSAWSVFKPCHHECHSTPNQEALPSVAEFDAVVINLPLLMLGGENLMEYLTMPRSPHQRYVMYSGEAPLQPAGFVYAKYQQPRDFPYYKFNSKATRKSKQLFFCMMSISNFILRLFQLDDDISA